MTKKIILCSAVILNSLILTAQTSKGKFIVGGSVGFNSSKGKYSSHSLQNNVPTYSMYESNYNSFNFSPVIGYFIAENLAIGLSAGIIDNIQSEKGTYHTGSYDNYESTYKNNGTTFGLFARKYILLVKNFDFYTGISAGAGPTKNTFTRSTNNSQQSPTISKGMAVNAGLNLGFAYFPVPKIGLHAGIGGLGWSKSSSKTNSEGNIDESTYDNSGFYFNLNSLTLNFGIYYLFGGRKS